MKLWKRENYLPHEIVDLGDGQRSRLTVFEGHGDEAGVGIGRLGVGLYIVVGTERVHFLISLGTAAARRRGGDLRQLSRLLLRLE